MRVRDIGKIRDGLWFLGRREACVYLLEGRNGSMLINGGMTFVVPDMLEQFRTFNIDESKINRFLILHSHFDHCGVVPFFKRRHPEMVIFASQRAWDVYRKPSVIASINESNRYAAKSYGFEHVYKDYDLDWYPGITGVTVSDGESIDLGDVSVRVLETPGHAPCCLSAYVEVSHTLFPSEAAGIPYKDRILPYGTSNFVQFQKSLHKLKDLRVDCLCSDHWGYLTGDEARGFITSTIKEAERRRILMHEAYQRTGNLDDAARELAALFEEENLTNMLPAHLFEKSFRNMVKCVVGLKS